MTSLLSKGYEEGIGQGVESLVTSVKFGAEEALSDVATGASDQWEIVGQAIKQNPLGIPFDQSVLERYRLAAQQQC